MKNWLYLIVLLLASCVKLEPVEYAWDYAENNTCNCACDSFPNEGLVAYYPFNGNTLDESGNENHPLYDTSILSVDRNGEEDKSVYFSGEKETNYIQLDIDTQAITETSAYTLSLWVYREGLGTDNPRVLEFWGQDGPGQLGFTWENNGYASIGVMYENDTVDLMELPVESSIWHHIVWTVDSTNTTLYVDGAQINQVDTSGTPSLVGNVAFGMMNHPYWDSFNGRLDDIGIWSRVLNEDEINYLFIN